MKSNIRFGAVLLALGTVILAALGMGYSRTSHNAEAHAAATEPLKEIDWEHVGDYRRWIDRSTDPRAIAFRQAVARGPVELAKAKAFARKAGMPLMPAELQPPLPRAENAAKYYETWNGFNYTDPAAAWTIDSINPLATYPPADLDAARKEMPRNQASLDLLHRATALPHYMRDKWWDSYSSEHLTSHLSSFARMREAIRSLRAESYLLYAKSGNYTTAISEAALGFRLADQCAEGEPTILGCFLAKAVRSVSLATIRDYLYLAGPNQVVDKQIQMTLQHDWPQFSLQRAFAGNAIINVLAIDESPIGILVGDGTHGIPASQLSDSELKKTLEAREQLSPADRLFLTNLSDMLKARIIHSNTRMFIAAAQACPGLISAMGEAAHATPINDLPSNLSDLADDFALGDLGFSSARDTAAKDVVLLGAAVLEYKARTGMFPTNLPEAMRDPPTSPFGGKPYFYQRTADGFLVSVVPPGQPIPGTRKDWKALTVEFRYPAPAALRKKPESYAEYMKGPHWPVGPTSAAK